MKETRILGYKFVWVREWTGEANVRAVLDDEDEDEETYRGS